jgi:hypothetical protein
VPDPPPVQLVDDARTSQPAGRPARASREQGRRDRDHARAEGAVNDGADGDRASAAAPSSPPVHAPPGDDGDD